MFITTSNRFAHNTERNYYLVLIVQVKQPEKQIPVDKSILPYKSNRMIYFARFLVKRNCQHFPHHCSPFTKHYFVKMFPLTNMNNSTASLHL